MSVTETVEYLVEALGGKATSWATWLSNDRKTCRKQQLPTEAGPGRPRYDRDVVDAFVDKKRAKVQQESVISADESSTQRKQPGRTDLKSPRGRRFNPHISALTEEDEGFEGGDPFVMLVTASPLALFQLNASEARQIAARLISAADRIDQSVRSAGE